MGYQVFSKRCYGSGLFYFTLAYQKCPRFHLHSILFVGYSDHHESGTSFSFLIAATLDDEEVDAPRGGSGSVRMTSYVPTSMLCSRGPSGAASIVHGQVVD